MYDWKPYVPVQKRLQRARAAMQKRAKQGHPVDPVLIEGRTIARTPWGKAWCDSLESYSDFANRLPRGRTYARNGSVVDLQLRKGGIEAYIAGSELYHARIQVTPIAKAPWKAMCGDCTGGIDSLVELLQGRLERAVMQRLCRQQDGLFPTPKQFRFACSCPDYAVMCKHVAAVLYGVGNRLDQNPELLFTLRGVDPADLISAAGANTVPMAAGASSDRILHDADDLGELFGLDLDQTAPVPEPVAPKRRRGRPPRRREAVVKNDMGTVKEPPRSRDLYGKLYRRLAKAGSLNSAEAQQAFGVSAADLRPLFKRLLDDGHATVTGKTRGTTYHLRKE